MVEKVFCIKIVLFRGEYIYIFIIHLVTRQCEACCSYMMNDSSAVPLEVLQELGNLTANHYSRVMQVQNYNQKVCSRYS